MRSERFNKPYDLRFVSRLSLVMGVGVGDRWDKAWSFMRISCLMKYSQYRYTCTRMTKKLTLHTFKHAYQRMAYLRYYNLIAG